MLLLSDIHARVLLRLNENGNSPAAVEPSGTSSSNDLSATAGFIVYYNAKASEICRTCLPLHGSVTWNDLPASTQAVTLAGEATTGNRTIWAARGVTYAGTQLTYCTRPRLEVAYPTWMSDATATPLYWYQDGDEIGLYPRPVLSTGELIVQGFAIPEQIDEAASSLTETLDWLPETLSDMLVTGIAAEYADKNRDDGALAVRAGELRAAYDAMRATQWATLDSDLRKGLYRAAGVELGLVKA